MSNIFYENDSGIVIRKYMNEIKKELFRKSIHVCTAFVPLFLGFNYIVTIALLCAVLVIYLLAETLRRRGICVPFFSRITDMASRQRDRGRFVLGPVTLCLGVILTAVLFNPVPAAVGIFALAFGDGIASLIGKVFGHIRIPFTQGKTLEGSLACFATVLLSSFLVLHMWPTALILATSATLCEMLPLKDYDNILIPLAVAFISQFILAI